MQRIWLGLGAIAGVGWATATVAQVIPDVTLGSEQSTIVQETIRGLPSDRIDGGAARGPNLFHSFEQLNVAAGRGLYFSNPSGIEQIFSRVTGSGRSEILGRLGVLGNANLFLLNPNGVLFGPEASLDLGGSFVATSASAVQFSDRGIFSATQPTIPPPLLTVNPSAFLFHSANPGTIENQSRADAGLAPSGTFNAFGLRVPDGKSLLLLGGPVDSNGGGIVAFGGQIEVGAIAGEGSVGLTVNGDALHLSIPDTVPRADILLRNQAWAIVAADGSGNTTMTGRKIDLSDSSSIYAGVEQDLPVATSSPGDIKLDASESLILSSYSNVFNYVINDVTSGSIGNAGNVIIHTGDLVISEGSGLGVLLLGKGQARDITIYARGTITLDTKGAQIPTGIYNQVASGSGNVGDTVIQASRLDVRNGAQVAVATFAEGNTGGLSIDVTGAINLVGRGSAPSGLFTEVTSQATGSIGDLTITTGGLSIKDGAGVSADTYGNGKAGNLFITANDFIEVIGDLQSRSQSFISADTNDEASGDGGNVFLTADNIVVKDNGNIATNTSSEKNAGSLTINANTLTISKSQVSSSTFGSGDAGNLNLHVATLIDLNGDAPEQNGFRSFPGGLFSQVDIEGRGKGGNLYIETKHLSVRDGSKVQVATFGEGDAGNLYIKAEQIDVFETDQVNEYTTIIDADVASDPYSDTVTRGNGGNLTIDTQRLSIRNGAEVSASTFGEGNAGTLTIHAADLIEVIGTLADLESARQGLEQADRRSGIIADVKSGAIGNGGNLNLTAARLTIKDGGQVSVSTFGQGDAGTLTAHITNETEISGQSSDQQFSSELSAAVGAESTGVGGSVNLSTGQLQLNRRGLISSQSQGQRRAGDVVLRVDGLLQATDGEISTSSIQGGGGNVDIAARTIILRGDSDIKTTLAQGQGSGGNITLSAGAIAALDDSDILAFAPEGQGGNITLRTRAFLSVPLYQPIPPTTDPVILAALDGNSRVDINASGTVAGAIVGVPDISFLQNSLTQLPQTAIDTNQLLTTSCIARNNPTTGQFLVTGTGGLPLRPSDITPSAFPTGEVRSLPASSSSAWKLGTPIVEPQGVYRLPNGQLVLSRDCPESTAK